MKNQTPNTQPQTSSYRIWSSRRPTLNSVIITEFCTFSTAATTTRA